VERIEYSIAHWRAYSGRTAEEERRTDELHRSPSVERSVLDGWDGVVSGLVGCYCSNAEKRLESMKPWQLSIRIAE
jgi:hypothetical protein